MTDETKTMTRGEQTNSEITSLLKARHTLLWIETREEMRVERAIIEAAGAAQYVVRFWDCATGLTTSDGKSLSVSTPASEDESAKVVKEPRQNERTLALRDPGAVLDAAAKVRDRCVYVLRDLHKWFDPMTLRALRSLAKSLQSSDKAEQRSIIILTPSNEIPPELAGHATVVNYPLPDRKEIERLLDDVLKSLPDSIRGTAAQNGAREAAIDAAVGLSSEEAANCYAKSLVVSRRIDPVLVSAEKRRVIARERVLTWIDPDPRGLDAVGGLGGIKQWLQLRRSAFSAAAREFGLPAPRGMLLLGHSGTGKSLTAKCVAAAWGMPLLRLDMGALKSKWVGESEANIRKALAVAETVSPCVLWLDELDKSLAGSTGAQGDGGVSADYFGAILSWMQERQGSVFVIATANDISALPPEILRKGRFDEIFFVDLPTPTERVAVLLASLKQYGRSIPETDLALVVTETDGFTGAELAALIPDGLFAAFNDGARALAASDLLAAAKTVVPLAKTAAEKIEKLRAWAKGRARPASLPEAQERRTQEQRSGRVLDL